MLNILLTIKVLIRKIKTNTVFIFEIRQGRLKQVKGAKHLKFLNDCEDIVKENKLTNGIIYGERNNGKIQIKTSSEIPKNASQRIRNLWSFYS